MKISIEEFERYVERRVKSALAELEKQHQSANSVKGIVGMFQKNRWFYSALIGEIHDLSDEIAKLNANGKFDYNEIQSLLDKKVQRYSPLSSLNTEQHDTNT